MLNEEKPVGLVENLNAINPSHNAMGLILLLIGGFFFYKQDKDAAYQFVVLGAALLNINTATKTATTLKSNDNGDLAITTTSTPTSSALASNSNNLSAKETSA
jgi:hypothetical protein